MDTADPGDAPPLAELLTDLVAISSVNPSLVEGAPGEREITDFIAGWLQCRGVTVTEIPAASDGDRPSLLCRVPGTGGGRSLLLYAHTDTVGVAGMAAPFTATLRDGRVTGRGVWDMKASIAAILRVAAEIAVRPCAGDVWLMLVADEESGSAGTEAVLRELAVRGTRPDACLVTEPSDLRVMLGHRGFVTGRIVTRGRAAHTARRDEGVDAIAMMAHVIVWLEDLDARMQREAGHPLLGHSAVVASLVHGGSELFVYPAECHARFVWRTLPGQTTSTLNAEMERLFAALRGRNTRFDASVTWDIVREPMITEDNAPIARAVADAARHELGRAPEVSSAPWWTDAALVQSAGIPSVIFGPPGGGIHAVDEWVDLAGLERFERILLRVTRSFCG